MTKIIALTLAALVGTASFAAAESQFTLPITHGEGDDNFAELGLINADGDGYVQVFDIRNGMTGALLGTEEIHAGPNPDVRVPLTGIARRQALAVLVIDGEVAATRQIRFN